MKCHSDLGAKKFKIPAKIGFDLRGQPRPMAILFEQKIGLGKKLSEKKIKTFLYFSRLEKIAEAKRTDVSRHFIRRMSHPF